MVSKNLEAPSVKGIATQDYGINVMSTIEENAGI